MGYEVFITRKEWHFDDEGPEISLREWKEYVKANPEFSLVDVAEAKLPNGKFLAIEYDGLAIWEAYSKNAPVRGGNKAWFLHSQGSITVKNPDDEILSQMCAVAMDFAAKVQGEEGEIYGPDGKAKAPKPPTIPAQMSSFIKKITSFFSRSISPIREEELPFTVGSTVQDSLGNIGTVVAIDVHAHHGLGEIAIKYHDGREICASPHAHGLEVVEQ